MEGDLLEEEAKSDSSDSKELNRIPLNKSMIQAEAVVKSDKQKAKRRRRKKKNKNVPTQPKSSRERSNTADADQTGGSKKALNLSILNETIQPKSHPINTTNNPSVSKEKETNENAKLDDNFDRNDFEIHKDESIEDSLFISRTEEDEELVQILTEKSNKDYDTTNLIEYIMDGFGWSYEYSEG